MKAEEILRLCDRAAAEMVSTEEVDAVCRQLDAEGVGMTSPLAITLTASQALSLLASLQFVGIPNHVARLRQFITDHGPVGAENPTQMLVDLVTATHDLMAGLLVAAHRRQADGGRPADWLRAQPDAAELSRIGTALDRLGAWTYTRRGWPLDEAPIDLFVLVWIITQFGIPVLEDMVRQHTTEGRAEQAKGARDTAARLALISRRLLDHLSRAVTAVQMGVSQ